MWKRTPDSDARRTGVSAEQAALQWLLRQGMKLITRNYRCKAGEIDLVMRDGQHVVFVEVRYRKQHHYGGALESVDWRKQKKVIAAANHFLLDQRQYAQMPCRFDVVANQHSDEGGFQQWLWVKDAFAGG